MFLVKLNWQTSIVYIVGALFRSNKWQLVWYFIRYDDILPFLNVTEVSKYILYLLYSNSPLLVSTSFLLCATQTHIRFLRVCDPLRICSLDKHSLGMELSVLQALKSQMNNQIGTQHAIKWSFCSLCSVPFQVDLKKEHNALNMERFLLS